MSDFADVKVALVAEHASVKFGGEAILPYHYFRIMYQRGVNVRLIVHERTKEELRALFPDAGERIFFISDTWFHKVLWRLGSLLPWRIEYFTTGWVSRMTTQVITRRKVRELVKKRHINLVHQVIPVSPKEPTLLFDLGVPVIIGPMNGGMSYPDGFKSGFHVLMGRLAGAVNLVVLALNQLLPGKRRADVVLVANNRTKSALPGGGFKKIINLVENGVDLNIWKSEIVAEKKRDGASCNFVFVGRLVGLKGANFLLEAASRLKNIDSFNLFIVGDGSVKLELMEFAKRKNLLAKGMDDICWGQVIFCGWKSQKECAEILANSDVLILPKSHGMRWRGGSGGDGHGAAGHSDKLGWAGRLSG